MAVGINQAGYSAGNPLAIEGRYIPWIDENANATDLNLDISIMDLEGEHQEDTGSDSVAKTCDAPELENIAIWSAWQIQYRDLVVLNNQQQIVHVRNLSTMGLQVPENYCSFAEIIQIVYNQPGITNGELNNALTGECPNWVNRDTWENDTPPSDP